VLLDMTRKILLVHMIPTLRFIMIAIIKNLEENPYNEEQHLILKQFSKKLDQVKKINSSEYGEYLKELLGN
jgi:hypothetical protein